MTLELIQKLQFLADKYENQDFIKKDPSKFMHQFASVADQEIAAFTAANLAFGRRDQILSHVQMIMDDWKLSPKDWILSAKYNDFFTQGEKSFYRMYTHNDMLLFFDTLKMMLEKEETIGEYVKKQWILSQKDLQAASNSQYLHQVIAKIFPEDCKLLPHSKDSAAKKVNMLLRWLVRNNSPVDLGLWTWYDKSKLLMPLDTHVLQESVKFGILEAGKSGAVPSGTLKTAVFLTETMKEAFPQDPVRGDYALFGLGVDN